MNEQVIKDNVEVNGSQSGQKGPQAADLASTSDQAVIDQELNQSFKQPSGQSIQNTVESGAQPQFRELAPERFWAGRVQVKLGGAALEDLITAIKAVASEHNLTFSGFLCTERAGEVVFEMTRYPRRAFGPVAEIAKYEANLQALVEGLSKHNFSASRLAFDFPAKESFRIVLGLEEGYLESAKRRLIDQLNECSTSGRNELYDLSLVAVNLLQQAQLPEDAAAVAEADKVEAAELVAILENLTLARLHTPQEVDGKLQGAAEVQPVQILAAGEWGAYRELAVLIKGDICNLEQAKHLADSFRQARIAVELIGPEGGIAYMVEFSSWCSDPDKE